MLTRGNLDNIQAGDTVIRVHYGSWTTRYFKESVTRTTKTQILIGNTRFRKADGAEHTSGWHRDIIYPCTPENEAHFAEQLEQTQIDLRVQSLAGRLSIIRWKETPLDKLERIVAILDE